MELPLDEKLLMIQLKADVVLLDVNDKLLEVLFELLEAVVERVEADFVLLDVNDELVEAVVERVEADVEQLEERLPANRVQTWLTQSQTYAGLLSR
jgi:predicted YcjX-like family ATPase